MPVKRRKQQNRDSTQLLNPVSQINKYDEELYIPSHTRHDDARQQYYTDDNNSLLIAPTEGPETPSREDIRITMPHEKAFLQKRGSIITYKYPLTSNTKEVSGNNIHTDWRPYEGELRERNVVPPPICTTPTQSINKLPVIATDRYLQIDNGYLHSNGEYNVRYQHIRDHVNPHIDGTTNRDASLSASSCSSTNYEQFSDGRPLPFLKEDQYTDVVLVVEGKKLFINKCILGYCSEYFQNLFETAIKVTDKKMEVKIRQHSYHDMVDLLTYLHPSTHKELTDNSAVRLLPIANEYGMLGLKVACDKFLVRNLRKAYTTSKTTVSDIALKCLQSAEAGQSKRLMKLCISILSDPEVPIEEIKSSVNVPGEIKSKIYQNRMLNASTQMPRLHYELKKEKQKREQLQKQMQGHSNVGDLISKTSHIQGSSSHQHTADNQSNHYIPFHSPKTMNEEGNRIFINPEYPMPKLKSKPDVNGNLKTRIYLNRMANTSSHMSKLQLKIQKEKHQREQLQRQLQVHPNAGNNNCRMGRISGSSSHQHSTDHHHHHYPTPSKTHSQYNQHENSHRMQSKHSVL